MSFIRRGDERNRNGLFDFVFSLLDDPAIYQDFRWSQQQILDWVVAARKETSSCCGAACKRTMASFLLLSLFSDWQAGTPEHERCVMLLGFLHANWCSGMSRIQNTIQTLMLLSSTNESVFLSSTKVIFIFKVFSSKDGSVLLSSQDGSMNWRIIFSNPLTAHAISTKVRHANTEGCYVI